MTLMMSGTLKLEAHYPKPLSFPKPKDKDSPKL